LLYPTEQATPQSSYSLQFCSFICQVASAKRQQSDLYGLQVKLIGYLWLRFLLLLLS